MRRMSSMLTRWWASQPRRVKIAGATMLAVALAAIGVLAWAMLSGSSSHPADVNNGLTVESVYSRAVQSMSRPGFVLHTTVTYPQATTRAGDTVTPKSELWLDGEADAARIHWTGITEGYADESENLIVGGYIYNIHRPINPGEKTSAERDSYKNPCSGSNHAVIGVLFECLQLPVDATTPVPFVDAEEFEGRQLLAIVVQTTASTSAESVTLHNALYLDPDTFLPVARATEYSTRDTSGQPMIARYQNEFLARSQIEADFFDPHAVGYGLQNAAQLLDALAQKTPIYWLGEEPNFDATVCGVPHDGSCPLVIEHVNSSPQNGAKGQLAYSYGEVTIEYWPPGYLDELRSSKVGQMLEDTRCAKKSETEVGGRTAVIYVLTPITYPLVTPQRNDSCYPRFDPVGGGPIYDGAVGYVDYGDVVVEVDGNEPGVYVTSQAIEATLNALQRR